MFEIQVYQSDKVVINQYQCLILCLPFVKVLNHSSYDFLRIYFSKESCNALKKAIKILRSENTLWWNRKWFLMKRNFDELWAMMTNTLGICPYSQKNKSKSKFKYSNSRKLGASPILISRKIIPPIFKDERRQAFWFLRDLK